MKDLITTVASLFLLMIFVLQFAGNQIVQNQLFRADMAIENFRDSAKEQGCVSSENRELLARTLSRICGCDMDQVQVSGTGDPVERGGLIYYQVEFPVENLVPAGKALGIASEENMAWFTDDGWVVSRFETGDLPDEAGPSGEEASS